MTPVQQTTLDKLLGINDVLLENYPQHSGPEFCRGMGQVAADLSELAEELEQSSRDSFEPARVWRYAGNAWFDLGNGKDPQALEQATCAYVHAETRLEDSDDSVEHMKLDYSLGQALLGLSKGENLELAENAQTRLRSALDIAHRDSGDTCIEQPGRIHAFAKLLSVECCDLRRCHIAGFCSG